MIMDHYHGSFKIIDHFIIHDYMIHDNDPWLIIDVKKLYDVYIVQFFDIHD